MPARENIFRVNVLRFYSIMKELIYKDTEAGQDVLVKNTPCQVGLLSCNNSISGTFHPLFRSLALY